MSNNAGVSPAAQLLPDLLEALSWCGWRIAQGLQETATAPGPAGVGLELGNLMAKGSAAQPRIP